RMVAMGRGLPEWCGVELRVYHPPGRRRSAGPGAKEKARLGLRGRDRQRQIARDRGAIQSRELEERRDLGGGVEVALRVLHAAGVEERAPAAAAARDEGHGELPDDAKRARGGGAEEHRARRLPPAEDVEDEIPAGLQHRSYCPEGREDRGPRDAIEHAAEDGH